MSQAIADGCSPTAVVGVDASPGQIVYAREHRSCPNVTYEIADALVLPFEDEAFDVAVCGLGLNFVPQPERALHEMRRVTRRHGTAAAYVWDYAQGARFVREFWDAAIAVDPETSAFDQARRFAFCTPDGLRTLFGKVNLEKVTLGSLEVVTRFANFDDYWEPFSSGQGSAPNYLATRSDDVRNAIRECLRASLPTNAEGAIALPALAWAIRGRCP